MDNTQSDIQDMAATLLKGVFLVISADHAQADPVTFLYPHSVCCRTFVPLVHWRSADDTIFSVHANSGVDKPFIAFRKSQHG